jgi:hypothetical protein
MSPTTDKSKMSRQDRLRRVVPGAQKHFTPDTSFTLAGSTFTLAQFVQFCEKDIAASDAAVQSRASWLTTVQVERDTHKQSNPVLGAFKSFVASKYGVTQNAGETLADFGYTPRKARTKTVATKNAAVAKALATRQARGTMGPRAKLLVKGTVATPPAPVAGAPAHATPPATAAPPTGTATPALPSPPAPPPPPHNTP